MSPKLRLLLQAGASLLLLALLWRLLDGRAVVRQLAAVEPLWIVAGLALSVPQTVLSAERWRFTAARLGAALPFRRALAEYYLALLLNQLLPGGMAGDGLRALRHGRSAGAPGPAYGPALRAVILERAAGNLALAPFAVAGAFLWLPQRIFPWLLATLLVLVFFLVLLLRRPIARRFVEDAAIALLSPAALPRQVLLSLIIFATYVLVFACAARAVGLVLDPVFLMTAVPLVLIAMALPLSIAGWGLREAMAVLVFAAAALPVEIGLAASVAYGVTILLAALPGALVPLFRW